jgi:hypothetical protein
MTGATANRSEKIQARAELFAGWVHYPKGRPMVSSRCPGAESNQDEIDQRNQGRADAGGDQGVISAEVALGFEWCALCFFGHFERLGRAGRTFCEVDHIRRGFLRAFHWNGPARSGLVTTRTGQGRRWASNFNHGDRKAAKDCGCRCWSIPWKKFPAPIAAACPAVRPC